MTVALAPRTAEEAYQPPASPFDLQRYHGALLLAYQVAFAIILAAVAVAAASLVVRFNRARGTERQQLRWVALAAALVALIFVVVLAGVALDVPALAHPAEAGTAALVVLMLGISAATLGYRLYDIDRIINRTLVYGALTAILAGAHALIVTLAGTILKGSNMVTAGATLTVAALFQPLRRRIQDFIDRRFYRRKYGAARTVEAFSTRLRDEVDLEAMRSELLSAVEESMQPRRASVWLRTG